MKLPDGCGDLSGKYARLEKALYGLKKTDPLWNNLMVVKLVTVHDMSQCKFDPSLRDSSDPGGQDSTDLDCTCRRHGGSWF